MRSNGPSDEEINQYGELYELMWHLDEFYFKDMGFRLMDMHSKLDQIAILEDGKWITVSCEDDSYLHLNMDSWRVVYSDKQHSLDKDTDGECRGKEKILIIRQMDDKRKEGNNLLHEMIHAYEAMLSQDSKEYLLIYLYRRLEKLIGRRLLDRYIDLNAHTDLSIYKHSTLFLLKSLALDRWLKLPYGTIFAYGRQEWKV